MPAVPNHNNPLPPETKKRLQELFTRGNEQMLKGNYDYADDIYFTECVLGDPENPIYLKTFLSNLKKKFGDKHTNRFRTLLSQGKKAVTTKPEQSFKNGIYTLKNNPWDVTALLETGDACEKLGYFDVAVEYYRIAVETEPDSIAANTVCASALKNIADYEGALACVNRILKKHPTDHETLLLRQELSVEMTIHRGKYRGGDAGQVREAANSLIADDEDAMGRRLTTPQQIERRIKRNPDDIGNYVELGEYYYQQGDLANVEECYSRAVAVFQNDAGLTERFLEVQKRRLQQKTLDLKAEYEKTNDTAIKESFFAKRKEYEAKKRELILHRIKINPNHGGYRYDYGLLLLKDGKVKEAITEFQTAKAESAVAGDCLFALGQCFQLIKQYKLAMSHYKEAVEALPNGEGKKKALYQTAKLAMALGDDDTAETYANQLAALDYSFLDIASLLDQISEKKENHRREISV
ncbi:hypothetical protein FACS189419_06180 [Planctomycetales bacterium]|nr:hypothetical protein FACS189419_06180 [Planctomycetales bacterium]